ncbi:MAG: DUF1559 domain-containing protein [Planctomycetaceae bacterium]|nr:DUF1559 domain-containing protein [Planctomycetaceae bacterium]
MATGGGGGYLRKNDGNLDRICCYDNSNWVSPKPPYNFWGFTLVELLVVIAIIGLLIALLLPAIQAARNAANRAACASNMKNLVLALHNHHDANEVLPVGAKGLARGTWATFSLPYLEQEALYLSYNMNLNYNVGANLSLLRNVRLPIFTCPSDGIKTSTYESFQHHNYLACEGDAGVYNPDLSTVGWAIPPAITGVPHPLITELHGAMFWSGGGAAGPHRAISFNDVSDGLSNTLAISETIQGERSIYNAGGTSARDIRGLIWYGLTTQFTTYLSPNTKQEGNDSSLSTSERDDARSDRLMSFFIDSNPDHGTIHYPEHPVAGPLTGDIFIMSARSFHTNGVNAGLGDGGVRFVNDSVNISIWRAVGNSQGGEALSLP